jgi:prophage regulatory protein
MTSTDIVDRIIDRHELKKLVPYSITHILRLEAQGEFPERIRLGPHRVGWSLAEVLDWITERKSARAMAAE